MGKYCFGVLFRIIHYCSKPETGQKELGSEILKIFNLQYGETVDGTKISKLYNCAEGLSPDYTIKPAQKMAFEQVKADVNAHIMPFLDENKLKLVILANRQVILDDDIKDETTVGVITKSDLRTREKFDFLDILTGFLIYVCTNTKNRDGAECIDEITEEYVESFKAKEDEIVLNSTKIVASEELKNTVVPNSFFEAFHEVDADLSLGLKNNNQLRLFRLACDEGEYSYEALGEFLLDNIGSYVYSREKRKDFVDRNRVQSIGARAMHTMMQNGKPGARDVGNDLAQILVYAFLEEVLKAPKIMSKVEIIQENGLYKSKSDSIHFLTLEHNGKRVYELVFGAANISLGIKEAVDEVMETVKAISKDSKKEKGIISGTLLNKSFDAETTNFLKSVLLPSKQNVQRPNMAYGLFLGYSIDIKSDVDHFEEDAAAKLEKDVRSIIPYLTQKINELNLADRSFYIYFLPFNDAVKDKITIMKALLMAGGDE